MPTFTAQIKLCKSPQPGRQADKKDRSGRNGLVLTELIVVIIMISLMTALTLVAFTGTFARGQFEKQAYGFIKMLEMAQDAAAQTDTRYAVVLDFTEGTYTLRQFETLDLETIPPEEAILATGRFTEQCRLDYVLFDDFADTRREGENITEARLYAGHSGWQYGAKIVLRDINGNPYSVIINRINKFIELRPGDADILVPVENVQF